MKRILSILLGISLLITSLCGCGAQSDEAQSSETETEAESAYVFAMDTVMTLTVYGNSTFLTDAEAEIMRLESLLSVTNEESDIAKLNAAGSFTVDDTTRAILARTLELSESTGGALDPTAYSLVKLWGFTREEYHVPAQSEIDEALATVGAENVQLDGNTVTLLNGAQIDLGAVVKGYTGARLAEMAEEVGVETALFQLGGNVQTWGQKPDGSSWHIAIQDPADESAQSALLTIPSDAQTMAVITSGVYQRYFEEDGVRYHHIMDPETGAPARSGLASVTILSEDGLRADALSTALLVMGLEDAADYWRQLQDFDAVFITDEGELYATRGLEGNIEADNIQWIDGDAA